jgi:CheY-like chemotaxis protein
LPFAVRKNPVAFSAVLVEFYELFFSDAAIAPMKNCTAPMPALLAEDEENDVFLMRRAFQEANVPNPLRALRNGQGVILYFLGAEGAYSKRTIAPWPGLLLLNLKMPVRDGWDVLAWWQEPGRWKNLPVVVLTSSDDRGDLERAMIFGANDYPVKPVGFKELNRLTQELRDCWLTSGVGTPATARAA